MVKQSILIVGAGIAGLSLYRALRQRGLDATLVERSASLSASGAGICLPANAMAGLQSIGLKHKVLDAAHQVTEIEYAKANGRTLTKGSLTSSPFDEQPFVALRRDALVDILADGIEPIRFNCAPQRLEHTQEGTLVEFSDGYSQFFDLIIGADGIHSKVRTLAFGEEPIADLGVSCWRFITELKDVPQHPRYLIGKDDAFMFYPLGNNKFYCYAQSQDKKKRLLTAPKIELLKRFKRYEPCVIDALTQAIDSDALISGRLESTTGTQFYHGNIVLVGDALHGCPPSLQQGVGLTLEDTIILARLLSRYPYIQALPRYQQHREKRVQWVVNESNRIIKLANKGRFFPGRLIRNMMLRSKGPANMIGWQRLLQDDPLTKVL
ncbi:monooxygenase [Corallincola holothuriorum]|uniref:Monooxygenase n=1 Tax=Corallincola holothuriorum TaxID=2282215 RepID=A0A368NQJ9_9GAMM|nr:FAD-dependent monooxygenase [Corallincola holothuriorum]RCU52822.1 monooxygenase [Corallincola holothuriorum]